MPVKPSMSALLLAAVFCSLLPSTVPVIKADNFALHSFDQPVDAISFRMTGAERGVEVSYLSDSGWSDWITNVIDDDQQPGLLETEMIMLPLGVTDIRVRGSKEYDVHPIRVSSDPVSFQVAATKIVQAGKRVLSRSDWGADDSILLQKGEPAGASASEKGDNGGTATLSARDQECLQAQREYADQFSTSSTVTKDAQGRRYRWPLQYSKEVRLFVVHHTALLVSGDTRSAAERVRALYKYHADSRGWGDIGYNYVIDESGQVYEGRHGGKYVVAGHAYCNNVGTIGISLLGNFELEQPTQDQVKSVQWLIDDLAKTYNVNLSKPVEHHGKQFVSPIAGHRDLVSTTCPGYYMYGAMGQVIANVKAGNIFGSVNFPALKKNGSSSSSVPGTPGSVQLAEGLRTQGRTGITINPGGKQKVSLTYTPGLAGGRAGTKVADVKRSQPTLFVWQQDGQAELPVNEALYLAYDVPAGEQQMVQLIVQAPMTEGSYWLDVGGIRFTFSVAGRRVRTGTYVNPFSGNPANQVSSSAKPRPNLRATGRLRTNPLGAVGSTSTASSAASTSRILSNTTVIPPVTRPRDPGAVRIRLSIDAKPSVTFASRGLVGDMSVSTGQKVVLSMNGTRCEASVNELRVASDVLILSSDASGYISVDTVKGKRRSYRGLIECRVVDGQLALINELPLDTYMQGLSEEPDTEPYQKQRAFAIAARTYAAYYIKATGDKRKFPGKPYDGYDDPAIFQAYAGVTFEQANPRWLDAVTDTVGQVLTVDGTIIKPPYFSASNGRTIAPVDVGWRDFPFADVFAPKDDPWCKGMTQRGHGVGMSGCGAKGQANEGRSGEQILQYYYPGTRIGQF